MECNILPALLDSAGPELLSPVKSQTMFKGKEKIEKNQTFEMLHLSFINYEMYMACCKTSE